ncbi:MAG: mechanosensitive ion channel family protein [Spirochaetia bacterium]|nr:mechanosensitive ion channel family protein [Spirochaetia bacterium]
MKWFDSILSYDEFVTVVALLSILGLCIFPGRLLTVYLTLAITRRSMDRSSMLFIALQRFIWLLLTLACAYVAIRLSPLTKPISILATYFQLGAIALITLGFMNVVGKIFSHLATSAASNSIRSASLISIIVRIAIFVFGFLLAMQILGVSVTPVLTALGVGGLAVALGLQETLSNVFAGLTILFGQKLRVGDFVTLESGAEGFVSDIGWRTTSIRQLSNSTIVVPNATMARTTFTNYQLPGGSVSILVELGVAYGSQLDRVEKVCLEVAGSALDQMYKPGMFPDFMPLVRFHTFADSSIDFTVVLRVSNITDQYLLKSIFIKMLHERFKTEQIEIPFPIRTVHISRR